MADSLSQKLLAWYDKHHRCLPWRLDPQMRRRGLQQVPYHVWLSEIMLQQTTVATVKDYYEKFISLWPDIHALQQAGLEDVLKNWAGLGYYSRARNLKSCADMVVERHHGVFPQDYDALRALPGIGDYTACAIMSIAFDIPSPAVDGNVERIIARLYAITTAKPHLKNRVRAKMLEIMPATSAGDFVQAMMDLGSLICTAQKPQCSSCPLNNNCLAFRGGNPARLPLKADKKQKRLRTGTVFVVRSNKGRILLRKRPPHGLLAGMSEVPNHFAEDANKHTLAHAPFQGDWHYQGEIVHIFTHFRLEMSVYLLTNMEETQLPDGWWVDEKKIRREALPTLMKKAIARALPNVEQK